jgi:hypothetical protein
VTLLMHGSEPRAARHGSLSTVRAGAPSATLRTAVAGVAAVVLAHVHVAGRPATLCPLRALTGVPCPLCGGTTAAVRLGHFNLTGALAANPVVVIAGAALLAAPLALGRTGLDRLSAVGRRRLTGAIIAALVFSEVWQLIRFGLW